MRPHLRLLLTACTGGDPSAPTDTDTDPAATTTQWFRTCGDPACGGYTAPTDIPVCTDQIEGAACDADGDVALCALADDACNVRLTCASEDPTQGPGGCPISVASAKSGIRYVTAADRAALAAEVQRIRLTTYTYAADPAATPRLGFLIDDGPPAATVFPHGQRVDLYGTTSLTIAAVQEQQRALDALAAQVEALTAEVRALRAGGAATSACSPGTGSR